MAAELRNLGLANGDAVWMHSSSTELGPVGPEHEGGAAAAVGAVHDSIGGPGRGLLIVPSFNLLDGAEMRMAEWDVATSASTVGWLT